jgi:GTP-binding protein Era
VLLNKADLAEEAIQKEQLAYWQLVMPGARVQLISALHGSGTDNLVNELLEFIPIHPPFYPKDQLTEHPERFFAAEIIREKIFLCYREEVPYSTEVVIEEFKDKEDVTVIRANILVERTSQKGIIIGHQGKALKKVGTEARKDLEAFLGRKVFLETHVKVAEDWRNDPKWLNRLGYGES